MLRKTSKQRAEPNRNVHIPSDLHRAQSAAQPPRYQSGDLLLFITQLSSSPLQIVFSFSILKLMDLFCNNTVLDF